MDFRCSFYPGEGISDGTEGDRILKEVVEKAFVLDIGSASVRLIVGGSDSEGNLEILYNSGVVTLLRKGLDSDNRIDPLVAESTLGAVDRLLRGAGVIDHVKGAVLCTQTIRQAIHAEWFLDRLERMTGVRPEIISGAREGQLAMKGSEKLMKEGDLLVDFGGGSTEIIFKDPSGQIVIKSHPVGAGIPLPVDRSRIRAGTVDFQSVMNIARRKWSQVLIDTDILRTGHSVVLGGTVTNLGAIYFGLNAYQPGVLHGKRLRLDELADVIRALSMMSDEETASIRGLEKGRESIIFNGGCLLVSLCEVLGIKDLTISEQGIRFGRLMEFFQDVF
jgi:exopolyphosphatase / guanosine-5'-triphosphate,3'-diphosphate pyrophosphatase